MTTSLGSDTRDYNLASNGDFNDKEDGDKDKEDKNM